jgi:hypothetical protein
LDFVDTFAKQNSRKFWIAVILTGVCAGLSAALLYTVLQGSTALGVACKCARSPSAK